MKSESVVENHPDCDGGFGVVDSDGELKGCYTSQAAAEEAIAQHEQSSDDDMSDDVMKQTLTNENTPSRNAMQGQRGKVSESLNRKKKKVVLKAAAGSVSSGDFVAYSVPKPPQSTQYAKGKIESVKRSGTVKVKGTNETVEATEENPVAIVRVYRQINGNKYVPTDRRVAKKISNLKKLKPLMTKEIMNKAVSGQVKNRLNELVTQHNQKYGNVNSKKVTVGMLSQVFERGIGAYRTNPGSVRPNVASAE